MITAVCPGSFDPCTLGHLDIIARASKMFDRVCVAVMSNPAKLTTFTADERVMMLKKITAGLPNIEIEAFDGLLADYVRQKGVKVIVKGLRAISDFEYEFQQALANRRLNPDMETVFLTTSADNMFLSSSVVKQIASFSGDISSFVPKEVHNIIAERLRK